MKVSNLEKQVGSLKTVLRLAGTNLDATKTEVRAIDENGVIWPVYHIPECDGSWRFVGIDGVNKNGVIGDGNSQFVEILPPRYAGTNKTYTIQVALDGVHFLDSPTVTLTVDNSQVKGQEDEWVECGKDDIINITAKYIDQKTGKEIVQSDVYQGYSISMYRQFDIGAKDIEGYKLVKAPNMDEYKDLFYRDKPTSEFVFEYVADGLTEEPEKPTEPENPEKPSNPENPSKPADKPSTTKPADLGKGTGTVQNTSTTAQSNTVKTGDEAPIVPYTVVAGISLLGIVTALFKRKKEDK